MDIMIGSALKLAVQGKELDKNETKFYFPPQTSWCDVYNFTRGCYEGPHDDALPTKAYDAHALLRNGYIIPY